MDEANGEVSVGRRGAPSLEGLHGTIPVPPPRRGFWAQWRAYAGPALLVSVGYMDPGNWATDLQAGAEHQYGLLWVVALASVMAIFMQVCAARLGVVTRKDLAQACRDFYPAWTRWPNWLTCEVAIAACDLAEVLGSAVAGPPRHDDVGHRHHRRHGHAAQFVSAFSPGADAAAWPR